MEEEEINKIFKHYEGIDEWTWGDKGDIYNELVKLHKEDLIRFIIYLKSQKKN